MRNSPLALVMNPDELGQDPLPGLDLAVRLGIEELEIRSAYGMNAVLLDDGRLRRLRAEAQARGLSVRSLASPLFKWCREDATTERVDSFGFPTHLSAKARTRHVERAMKVAELLGARQVRIFSHLRVEEHLTERLAGDPLLRQALARATDVGVTLLLENEPVCTAASAAELLELVRSCHEAGLRLWLDIANLHEVGDARSEAVTALAPYVEYVHVKDYRSRDGRRTFCPAGAGEVPHSTLLPALARRQPHLPYAIETHARDRPAETITRTAAYLRSLEGLG